MRWTPTAVNVVHYDKDNETYVVTIVIQNEQHDAKIYSIQVPAYYVAFCSFGDTVFMRRALEKTIETIKHDINK